MRTSARKHEPWFEDLRDEFNLALPAIIAGKLDRTDLMKSCKRIVKGPVTVREIIGAVSRETDVAVAEITGGRGTKRTVRARSLAMCLANDIRPDYTFSRIAREFKRERSTVNQAIDRARELIDSDPEFRSHYQHTRWRLGLA